MRFFFFALLLIGSYHPVRSQNFRHPIKGYRESLVRWYVDKDVTDSAFNSRLDAQIDMIVNRNSIEMIVPTETFSAHDTIVAFYYTSQFLKKQKKHTYFFPKIKPNSRPYFIVNKHDVKIVREVDFDSVYHLMSGNIAVNTELFDVDRFLEMLEPDYCCRFSGGVKITLDMIYFFFIHGILLGWDIHSGRLYYLSY